MYNALIYGIDAKNKKVKSANIKGISQKDINEIYVPKTTELFKEALLGEGLEKEASEVVRTLMLITPVAA